MALRPRELGGCFSRLNFNKSIRPCNPKFAIPAKMFGSACTDKSGDTPIYVKTIEIHQVRMKEKLAVHSATNLRQKAPEWLAKSAVNRIHEDPESE